jgi:hypothetical protein
VAVEGLAIIGLLTLTEELALGIAEAPDPCPMYRLLEQGRRGHRLLFVKEGE